jgi:hypothetical protein
MNEEEGIRKTQRGYSQYQHQSVVLHDTLGLIFMSILALVLLIALLRQQSWYRKLVERMVYHI